MRKVLFHLLAVLLASALALTITATPANAVRPNKTMQAKIVKLINKARVNHGCKALRVRAPLQRAAKAHTVLMGKHRTLSHQFRGERSLGKRITKQGYRWRAVGENVAMGYPTARRVVRAWLKSPHHRHNILNCTYRDTGVSAIKMHGVYWFTQDFGRRM